MFGVIVGGPLAADANAASGSGVQQQPAFDVSGDTHTLQGNKAHDNFGDGFHIIGNTHTLTGNVAKFNGEDGIDIDGGASGVILDGNVAKGNGGVGIEVSPNVTIQSLTNNIAKTNNLDFCNDGMVTMSAGNHFGTTGTPGSCSIIGD